MLCERFMPTQDTILDTSRRDSSSASVPPCPELLAPAGDWECAKAAVENGADAIYFGLERFNARMRAHNFTEADLPKLMEFLHLRGVKGYVTFNTLVFANEMADAEQYLRSIISAGVDAAIVQDVGICRLIRELSPDFPIHGSTQMTITSAGGVEFARDLGCNLVVLARECSIKEIEKIQAAQSATETSAVSALPLEVFVHGALCVAYSGQCLTSESLGGRSANRGECAQACRMPYELVSDGKNVPLGDKRYLLSPQDLAGLEVLPDLIRTGMSSLKIEGRLKAPEYVANITRVYRQALDRVYKELMGGEAPESSHAAKLMQQINSESRYNLEMGFSRGLYTGWFRGINNQELAHARFGKKRGVYLGEVGRIQGERIALKLKAPLKPGDGVVFDAGHPDQDEEGGRVYTVDVRGQESLIGFGHGDVNFRRVHIGDKLWKTNDPELDRKLRQSFEGEKPQFQRPISFEVHGLAGKPMTLIVRDEVGNVVKAESTMPMEVAQNQPLSTERLREQLGRLGGTPFVLGELKNHLSGSVMLPVSELNKLRREVVIELERLRVQPKRWTLNAVTEAAANLSLPDQSSRAGNTDKTSELIVLARNLEQLDAALKCGVQTLYCEFEDPKKYREAVSLVHCASGCAAPNRTIWVAPPRIFKMGEEWIMKIVRSSNADGYLVRNYDHLNYFADCRRTGDFSLNIANRLTADYFKNRFGLERVTASYDLNFTQLEALLKSAPPEWFEITIHQHMPMFHMEHCVFCAFLSEGTDYSNCGRPCDKHDVKLRDRVGAEHPLKADAGCRNTVFNSLAQTGAEYVARMMALGARHFRIEFLNETPEQVVQTITKYRQLLRGEIEGAQLYRELKLLNQLGVTRGQMAG
ncbi:peptidase U32 [Pedosphaera parvula Ellin514]|uniref:Peptidase U32 n=2 Tax=Pedosphaera TaxID=1032526 RepID=B9XGT7_PEDPL|nr:peptidase U32 [Pedosphaera parvula Ellin514]